MKTENVTISLPAAKYNMLDWGTERVIASCEGVASTTSIVYTRLAQYLEKGIVTIEGYDQIPNGPRQTIDVLREKFNALPETAPPRGL